MTTTEVIYAQLSGYTGLTDIVSTRIYNQVIPQDENVPAVVYVRTFDERVNSLSDGGGNGVTNTQFRITSYTKQLAQGRETARQIREAMLAATAFTALETHETVLFDYSMKLYKVVSDYSIWYKF